MKHFSMYSMMVGIGIGMIVAGIMNIFFINYQNSGTSEIGNDPFIKTISQEKMPSSSEKDDIDKTNTNNDIEDNVNANDRKENADKNIEYREIYINKGMSSEEIARLLEENEIIFSSYEFIFMANKLEVTNRLKYGLKKIPLESSIEDILEILVQSNQ